MWSIDGYISALNGGHGLLIQIVQLFILSSLIIFILYAIKSEIN